MSAGKRGAGGAGTSAEAPRFDHVPGLDGLRGLAVVAVLLFHAGHLDGGYLGVDLFFVLSGYLITSLLLVEHQRDGVIGLRAFWGRRMRRLLPALFGLMVGAAAYARWVARPIDLADIRSDALATLAYVANWHTIWSGSDYWDISRAPSPLQHTWSLAIEEQFYVVWPLVVWGVVAALARRSGSRAGGLVDGGSAQSVLRERQGALEKVIWRLAIAGTVVAFVLFVGLHHMGASRTRVYEGTDTRAGAIFLGVGAAVWAKRRRDRVRAGGAPAAGAWAVEACGIAAAVALGLLWFRLDGGSSWLYGGLLPVASSLGVVVVAAVSDPGSPVLGRLFSMRLLRWLGTISYGLYLWHWPIFRALEVRDGRLPFLGDRSLDAGEMLVAKLAVSVVVAVVSFVVIEQPIRRGRVPGRLQLPGAVAAAALTVVVVLAATSATVTGPSTAEVAVRADTEVAEAPTVLVVGDSVAHSMVRHLVRNPAVHGINPVNATTVGCAEVTAGYRRIAWLGEEHEDPAPACGAALGPGDLEEVDPDVVILQQGAQPEDMPIVDGLALRACDTAYMALYRERTGALVDRLGSTGATVGVATVVHTGETSLRLDGSDGRIDCVNEEIRRIVEERPFAVLIDVDGFLCPQGEGSCVEELGGGPIRSDGLHFDDGPGGAAVAAWMVDRLIAEG